MKRSKFLLTLLSMMTVSIIPGALLIRKSTDVIEIHENELFTSKTFQKPVKLKFQGTGGKVSHCSFLGGVSIEGDMTRNTFSKNFIHKHFNVWGTSKIFGHKIIEGYDATDNYWRCWGY